MTAAPRLRLRSIPAGAPWAARPTIMTSTPTSRSRASSPSTTSSITSTLTVSSRTQPSASTSPNISRTSTGSRSRRRASSSSSSASATAATAAAHWCWTHVRAALHQRPERGPQGGRLLLQSGSQRERGPGRSAGCAYVLNGRKLDYPIYFDTEPPAARMAVPTVWASRTAPSAPSPSARRSRPRAISRASTPPPCGSASAST